MHIPVPDNKLVAFTLAGALLTALVAGALAVPGVGLTPADDGTDGSGPNSSYQGTGDAPTPNQEFTPAVQQSGGEDEEYEGEEYEGEEYEDEEYEHEDDEDEGYEP